MCDALDLAPLIDHTVLRPEATHEHIERACAEAREYGFAGVCVRIEHVELAARLLAVSACRPISVGAVPTGAGGTAGKVTEARQAVSLGAEEIDMVINLAALKGRDYAAVLGEIAAVVESVRPAIVKTILETGALT